MASESGYDGAVKINTKLDERGFNAGMRRLTASAGNALNGVLFQLVKVGTAIRATFGKIGAVGAAIFKKLLLGGLLFFAVSAAKILATLRESIQDVINLKGGKTKEQFDNLKSTLEEVKASLAAAFLPLVEVALPYIQKALDWLVQMLNHVAMIAAAWTGQKTVMQVVAGSAAKLAKNAEKAKKATEGQLAAFDQINVLMQKQADTDATAPKVETQIVPVTEEAVTNAKNAFAEIAESAKKSFLDYVYWDNWKRFFAGLVEWLKVKWQNLGEFLTGLWVNFIDWFGEIINRIPEMFAGVKENIQKTLAGILEILYGVFTQNWAMVWDGLKNVVSGVLGAILAMFNGVRNAFGTALDWIGDKFRTVFEGIRNFVYNIVNSILGFINNVIDTALSGINAVLSAASTVSGAFNIPAAGGGIGGAISSLLGNISIPHLATGAVIPPGAEFLAVLGDQRNGKNIEAPAAEFERMLERAAQMGGGEITVTMPVYLDNEKIYEGQQRVSMRHGKSLIVGGAV